MFKKYIFTKAGEIKYQGVLFSRIVNKLQKVSSLQWINSLKLSNTGINRR